MQNTRNLISLLFALLLSTSLHSCIPGVSWQPVSGNGKTTIQDRAVADFSSIDVSGGLDVELTQGDVEGLSITADEDLQKYIVSEVSGRKLRIYTTKNFMQHGELKASIKFKKLDNINISGGGDVHGLTPIQGDALELVLSGGGDLDLSADLTELHCGISGGGDGRLSGNVKSFKSDISGGGDLSCKLKSSEINCTMSGGGDLEIATSDLTDNARFDLSGGGDLELDINTSRLFCTISGGGDGNIRGKADYFEVNINGGGNVTAGDLDTGETIFTASGGSNLHVTAREKLRGSISGGGNLYYRGNPSKVDINTSGGSEARKE